MIKRHLVPGAPPPPRGVVYHHATEADGWLYVTGQLPADPNAPQTPFAPGIEAQATRTFANLVAIVEGAGYALTDAVFVRVYLAEFIASSATPRPRRRAPRSAWPGSGGDLWSRSTSFSIGTAEA
jgi:enamine deaminase RidA (YjgF/YER057c/UK114 family)